MGIRMKKLFILLVLALALAFLFVACGDDESSFAPRDDESSSSIEEESSSSSVTLSGASAESNGSSSSSAKSSSSTDAKSSSSSSLVLFESSSSLSKQLQCLAECTEDCEGETYWHKDGFQMVCRSGQWLNLDSLEQANAPSSSSYFDMTEQFNEKVSYGEFTDPRDGQKYRTVSKYDDVFEKTYVFFAENLNYGKMVSGGTVQGDSTKYCYDNDPWYCENGWGGLYTWSNAMNFPAVCDSVSMYAEACSQKFVYPSGYTQPQYYVQHQGICPEGWHVASEGEWAYLQHSSVFDLGSKVAGFGNNGSGLSILPAGSWERYPNGSLVFRDIKKQAIFWTPQQSADDAERAHRVAIDSQGMSRIYEEVKAKRALSVRCVKNY